MFQMAHVLVMENNCDKSILKSIQNCRNYGPDKNMTFKRDLDLCLPVSNGTSTSDGKQMGQIILKTIHNCRR